MSRPALAVVAIVAVLASGSVAVAASPSDRTEWTTGKLPPYGATIVPVDTKRLGKSWRAGCPLGPADLRLLTVTHIGFDDKAHRGELIVAAAVAREVVQIFADLYANRFPIEKMRTVEKYDADDDKSMAANNTSAFNCRPITGGTSWSNHSYGRAIDINTVQNPYVSKSGVVSPPNGAPYKDRGRKDKGMIHAGDSTVGAFKERGWDWGGDWTTPLDYQHFEKPKK